MTRRFQELFRIPSKSYIEGSPLIIEAGVLQKDTATNSVLVQIKLRNIVQNNIISCKVSIKAFEINGTEIEGISSYAYLDINIGFGEEFGSRTPVYLPNTNTRRIEISISEVVFSDGSIWENSNILWKQTPTQKAIVEVIQDPELLKQYEIDVGEDGVFYPEIRNGLFQCTCGASNSYTVSKCYKCGRSNDGLNKIDFSFLQARADERIKEEKRIDEEQRIDKEVAEEKRRVSLEESKKKRNKTLKIVSVLSLLILGLISYFVISEPNYIKYIKYEFFESNIQAKYKELHKIDVFDSKSKSSKYFKEYIIQIYNNKEFQTVVDTLKSDYKYLNNASTYYNISDNEMNNVFEESLLEIAKQNKNEISKLELISQMLNRLESKYEKDVNNLIGNYYISKITDGSAEVRNYFFEKYNQTRNSADYEYLLKAIHYYISNTGIEYRMAASFDNGYTQEYGFKNLTAFYQELKEEFPNLATDQCYDKIKLLGYWSGGGRYFQLKSNGYISYDLPWFDYGDYYKLYDHTIMLFPENDESSTRNLFKITFINDTTIKVYCYDDGSTYTLYKG